VRVVGAAETFVRGDEALVETDSSEEEGAHISLSTQTFAHEGGRARA
jgi:hypothetical protein